MYCAGIQPGKRYSIYVPSYFEFESSGGSDKALCMYRRNLAFATSYNDLSSAPYF